MARYRLTTFAAVSQLPSFVDSGPRLVRRTLRQNCDDGLPVSAHLHQAALYWALSTVGAKHCGLTEQRSEILSEQAKIRAYAILHFCCLSMRHLFETQSDRSAVGRSWSLACEVMVESASLEPTITRYQSLLQKSIV